MTGIKAAITRTRSAARRVWTTAASRENTDVRVAVNGEDDAMLLRRSERTKERSASRPSIDDVTRISRGQRAKKRGTGSRMVCHRLNAEERRTYERATLPQHPPKNRVLVLHNGSNRRERKGSPLWNIYRLWCDSNAFPAVVCDLSLGHVYGSRPDRVVVDLSPLRAVENDEMRRTIDAIVSSRADGALLNEELSSDVRSLRDQTASTVAEADDGLAITRECLLTRPIWDLPVLLLTYDCTSRAGAKGLAKAIASQLCLRGSETEELLDAAALGSV